jgi:hypothetical protein
VFGPETLKVVGQAFDGAWQDIAGNFGADHVPAARLKLANIILATATELRRRTLRDANGDLNGENPASWRIDTSPGFSRKLRRG